MRQYAILYKRAGSENWTRLEPHVDANLYDNDVVTAAVEVMRNLTFVEGMSVRNENAQFNVMAFDQEAEAPKAFKF